MDEQLINGIVESLVSENVNEDYLKMYLNDSDLRIKCDEMVSNALITDLSNGMYSVDKWLNYLNNAVKCRLKDKPYLLNINVIHNTLEEYLDEFTEKFYNSKTVTNNDADIRNFEYIKNHIYNIINTIDDKFVFGNINPEAEERMANIYINRIKNNNILSKEQVEELLSFTLMGGFLLKHEEYTDIAFNYALKMILNNDYKIDGYLYKNLFLYSCRKILKERGIEDLSLQFDHTNKQRVAAYSSFSKCISFNVSEFKKNNLIKSFLSFFHELRHYEQYNGLIEIGLKKFLIDKDIFLSDELLNENYYKTNYNSLSIEKDACYTSYEYLYNFIKEKAPAKLKEAKAIINRDLICVILLQNKYISERKLGDEIIDLNVIFENLMKSSKLFTTKFIKSTLLIEYDIRGNKRSIFELLESKEYANQNGLNERSEIINYLLYEESVSKNYIKENLKLLDSKTNKEKYGKYYKEAKKILIHKMIKYKIDKLANKKGKLSVKNDIRFESFYDFVIDKLRKKGIKRLDKDKLYSEKFEELKTEYEWLYNLFNKSEEEWKKLR